MPEYADAVSRAVNIACEVLSENGSPVKVQAQSHCIFQTEADDIAGACGESIDEKLVHRHLLGWLSPQAVSGEENTDMCEQTPSPSGQKEEEEEQVTVLTRRLGEASRRVRELEKELESASNRPSSMRSAELEHSLALRSEDAVRAMDKATVEAPRKAIEKGASNAAAVQAGREVAAVAMAMALEETLKQKVASLASPKHKVAALEESLAALTTPPTSPSRGAHAKVVLSDAELEAALLGLADSPVMPPEADGRGDDAIIPATLDSKPGKRRGSLDEFPSFSSLTLASWEDEVTGWIGLCSG